MNKKEGNNKRTSSRPSSNKPKPAMAKRAQGPKKVKPKTVAPAEAAKPEKKANQVPKRPKVADEIRLNKYISNSGVCSKIGFINFSRSCSRYLLQSFAPNPAAKGFSRLSGLGYRGKI